MVVLCLEQASLLKAMPLSPRVANLIAGNDAFVVRTAARRCQPGQRHAWQWQCQPCCNLADSPAEQPDAPETQPITAVCAPSAV